MLNRDILPAGLWDELLGLQARYEDALAALHAAHDEEEALRERHERETAPWVRVRQAVCEAAYKRFEADRPPEGGRSVAVLQLKLDVAAALARDSFGIRTRDADDAQRQQLQELAVKMEGLQAAHDAAREQLLARLDYAHGLLVAAAAPSGNGTATEPHSSTATLSTTTANGQAPALPPGSGQPTATPASATA